MGKCYVKSKLNYSLCRDSRTLELLHLGQCLFFVRIEIDATDEAPSRSQEAHDFVRLQAGLWVLSTEYLPRSPARVNDPLTSLLPDSAIGLESVSNLRWDLDLTEQCAED